MSRLRDPSHTSLVQLLSELGIRTTSGRATEGHSGFPLILTLNNGASVTLDLPSPGPLALLDPDSIGVAIVDSTGHSRKAWGLARRNPFLKEALYVRDCPISSLLELGHGTLYLDGFRYYAAPLSQEGETLILVTSAAEERNAKREAKLNGLYAETLKRLGKALTMNQQTQQICVAAAHEIASAIELAAVLIWTLDVEADALQLVASVGANRSGTGALQQISLSGGAGCIAELVAATRQPFRAPNVADHVMTHGLEAKFCYLKPGGVIVHPLVISDKLLGVIEIVSRHGDQRFDELEGLFETCAEHLALALNSALLFEHFEKWATHDALTGIANHRSLQEFLTQRIAEAERTGQEVGVIMIDVDHFRNFNEEEGHDAGDAVLRMVAEALKSSIRPYDIAARYGGEEFTIVMPGSGRQTTHLAADRIRARTEQLEFVTPSGRERHITISLGCATYPTNSDNAAGLLKAADIALFDAKRQGRNRVVMFEGALAAATKPQSPSFEEAYRLLTPEEREAGDLLLRDLEQDVLTLGLALRLSPPQVEILRALLRVVPAHRSTEKRKKELEAAPAFRVLLPSLHALEERFDGTGAKSMKGRHIPLLGRVLSILLTLAEDEEALFADSGRFDPEIVRLLLELRDAA